MLNPPGNGKGENPRGNVKNCSFQQTSPLQYSAGLPISSLSKQIITPVRVAASCQSSVFSLPCNCSWINPLSLSLQLWGRFLLSPSFLPLTCVYMATQGHGLGELRLLYDCLLVIFTLRILVCYLQIALFKHNGILTLHFKSKTLVIHSNVVLTAWFNFLVVWLVVEMREGHC